MDLRKSNRLIAILIAFLFACSCDKPSYGYDFVSSSSLSSTDDYFQFIAELDEGISYDTSIALRYDATKIPSKDISLIIRIVSPSGQVSEEIVDFPLYGKGMVRDCQWSYRTGVRAREDAGLWEIDIKPYDPATKDGVRGIGFSYCCADGKR